VSCTLPQVLRCGSERGEGERSGFRCWRSLRRAARAAMSAAVAAVTSIMLKASELDDKGHYARAVEKQQAAVAAAQALGNTPDCLITAMLQLKQAEYLFKRAEAHHESLCLAIKLLMETTMVLERRKDTGTLLVGACRPVEVEWNVLRLSKLHEELDAQAALQLSSAAGFIGYEAYLLAASMLLPHLEVLTGFFLEQKNERSFTFVLLTAINAVNFLAQPRVRLPVPLLGERALFKMLYRFESYEGSLPSHPAKLVLLDAWNRLKRDEALLSQRGLNYGLVDAALRDVHADFVRRSAALATETRLTCALPACNAQEAHAAHFKRCAACKGAVYCCREHQVEHWPVHKAACKAARKPATTKAAASSSP